MAKKAKKAKAKKTAKKKEVTVRRKLHGIRIASEAAPPSPHGKVAASLTDYPRNSQTWIVMRNGWHNGPCSLFKKDSPRYICHDRHLADG